MYSIASPSLYGPILAMCSASLRTGTLQQPLLIAFSLSGFLKVLIQEVVEHLHVSLFLEEDMVGQVL